MKNEVIKNTFDSSIVQRDKYATKYLKYLGYTNEHSNNAIEAFKTKDINIIETALKNLANSIKSHIFYIGMGCVIIDRECLYADAGYHSYLDYAKHLYEETGLSPQRLSEAKIIIERYIDYNTELRKNNFNLEHNSHKLLYLESALFNHKDKNEVFNRLSNDTFRDFYAWAHTPDKKKVVQQPHPKIKITNGKITIGDKKYNDLPVKLQKTIETDFSSVCSIRLSGNAPVVTSVYDENEARSLRKGINKLLKMMRSKK